MGRVLYRRSHVGYFGGDTHAAYACSASLLCATWTTPEHTPRQAAHSNFSVHCVNAKRESLAVTVPSAPRSQGLGYYLDDPARAHEEWLASRAATAAAPGGAIGPAGPGRGGGGGDDEERLPRKSRLEVIAERQRQRNEGRGRGGGKAKAEDEELDPMDPVRRQHTQPLAILLAYLIFKYVHVFHAAGGRFSTFCCSGRTLRWQHSGGPLTWGTARLAVADARHSFSGLPSTPPLPRWPRRINPLPAPPFPSAFALGPFGRAPRHSLIQTPQPQNPADPAPWTPLPPHSHNSQTSSAMKPSAPPQFAYSDAPRAPSPHHPSRNAPSPCGLPTRTRPAALRLTQTPHPLTNPSAPLQSAYPVTITPFAVCFVRCPLPGCRSAVGLLGRAPRQVFHWAGGLLWAPRYPTHPNP